MLGFLGHLPVAVVAPLIIIITAPPIGVTKEFSVLNLIPRKLPRLEIALPFIAVHCNLPTALLRPQPRH